MEAELAALATSGATTLVGLMVSDAWDRTRQRLERLFARDGDDSAVARELQASREELVAARDAGDADAVADIEAGWRTRLRRVLRADPAAAQELRALLDELAPRTAAGPVTVVRNTISGGVQDTVVQGQTFSGALTFHAAPAHPDPHTPGGPA